MTVLTGGTDSPSLALWAGWLAWATLCAAAMRGALAWLAGRQWPHLSRRDRIVFAYATMAVIAIISAVLHFALFGQESLSLFSYLLAPFGLPLLAGGVLVLLFDVARAAASMARHRLPAHNRS